MSNQEKDPEFWAGISHSLSESTHPGMVERIDALFDSGIGRGFVVDRVAPDTHRLEQVKAGYILPLDRAQTQHIVVLRNGEIFKTTYIDKDHGRTYTARFMPNEQNVTFGSLEIDLLGEHFNGGSDWLMSRVMMFGDTEENVEQLTEDLNLALRTAVSMKKENVRSKLAKEKEEFREKRGDKVVYELDLLEAIGSCANDSESDDLSKDLSDERLKIELDDVPYGPEE